MHIAIIRRRFNSYGGAERFILRMTNSLCKQSIKTSIIAEIWGNSTTNLLDNSFSHIKINGITGPRSKRFHHFQDQVKETLKHHQFDIIQSHERLVGADIYRLGDGIHAVWIKKLSTIKPWYIRLWLKLDPFHQLLIKTEQAMAKDPQLTFVANSPMVAQELVDWYQVPKHRITIIENGIDTNSFQPATKNEKIAAKEKLGLTQKTPTILFIGSGFERKGAFQLAEAMSMLPEFQLIIVGHDKKIKQLKQLISNLNLESRIHVAGPQHDVMPYLRASDIFCLPSVYDSLPNAMLEALCCSLPVVITKDVGIAEKIMSTGAGLLSSTDPKDIADTIRAAWNNYDELSNNALALSKEFDIDIATKKWVDLYKNIIKIKKSHKKDSN